MDLNLTFAMIAAQASIASGPLAPTSPWSVTEKGRSCQAERAFGSEPIVFGLISKPLAPDSGIAVTVRSLLSEATQATLRNERTGEEVSTQISGPWPRGEHRYSFNGIDNRFVEGLRPGAALMVQAEGRAVATFDLGDFESVMPALEQCRDYLLEKWGIELTSIARLQSLPKPEGGILSWLDDDDYPAAALMTNASGSSTVRFMVTKEGRVRACEIAESSGSRVLDNTTCNIITKRGRYTPALDASGIPTEAPMIETIIWALPS